MNILSPRVDELVHELARLTGEDADTAVERAVQERLSGLIPTVRPDRHAALGRFLAHVAGAAARDDRPADEIVGYGPDGLPD